MSGDILAAAQLVESHRALVAQLGALERLAYHLGGSPGPAALTALDDAVVQLRIRLGEHMATEERVVYPAVREELGRLEVQSMVADHEEIRRWIDELGRALSNLERSSPDLDRVRWILYLLVGLVNLHLRKEELGCLRLLTHHLGPAAVRP